jgi:hypothetical protein
MELLTAAEALAQYNIGKRTFDRWVGSGHLKPREHRRHNGKGRPTALYDRADIARVATETPRKLMARTTAGGSTASTRPPPPQEPAQPPLDTLDPDELLAMLKRFRQCERVSSSAWAAAVREKRMSVAELAILQRSWKDAGDQVMRIEKALPEILYRKGRFVDVDKAGKIFGDAVAAMCAELDQVGLSVAPLCADKPAIFVRAAVDDAVRRARRQVEAAWKAMASA